MGTIGDPFVDPTAAAVELSCHLDGRDTGSIAFDGGSAQLGVFVIRSWYRTLGRAFRVIASS
jgi:hypothetical protein